jgi:hypothetical protein
VKEKEKQGSYAAQVLQECNEAWMVRARRQLAFQKAQQTKSYRIWKGKNKAISKVVSRYLIEKEWNGGRISNGSFERIRNKVLNEFDIPKEDIKIQKMTILSCITRNLATY